MSGRVIRILDLTKFDWGGASIAASTAINAAFVARGIDVSASRETVLLVRNHAFTSAGTGATMNVSVFAEAPSSDDPSVIFLDTTNALLSNQAIPTAAGSLYRGVITNPGGWITIQISATQGNAAGALKGTLSIDLSMKD